MPTSTVPRFTPAACNSCVIGRLDRMAKLNDAGAKLIALDLTDDASIVSCIDAIRKESGPIDVLVNNAG